MTQRHILAVFASLCAVACGSSSGNEPGSSNAASDDPCGLKSGFPGDDLCIKPPAVAEGIQMHVGPKSYDDNADLEPYVIAAGTEDVKCFVVRPQESGFYFFKQENRMRSGSHHMLILEVPDTGQAEGPTAACDLLGVKGMIPGAQTPKIDYPGTQLAPEDAGLARYLPAGTAVLFQLHYVNTRQVPLLREAWVNLYKMDASEVTQKLENVFIVGDFAVNVPPGARQTTSEEFTPPVTQTTRIFQMNGHSHAHSESFTVWRTRGTDREQIYQSFNWQEPDVLTFNSVVTNPTPDAASKRDGGISGLLDIQPGDKLEWACDVNNTTNAALHFSNEAYTAEMCLLAGSYIGDDATLFTGGCSNGSCSAGFAPATN